MSIFGHTKDVANICIDWATRNINMTWVTFNPNNSSLVDYAYDEHAPIPQLNNTTHLACFELPLLALVHGNYIDRNGLQNIYESGAHCGNRIDFLIPSILSGLETYRHGVTEPTKGHLVFFDGMNHVAILTGRLVNGEAQVVSFWAHTPPQPSQPNGPTPNTSVEFNTIEALQQLMVTRGLATDPPKVQIAKPVWR
jgi:hypothetical protein